MESLVLIALLIAVLTTGLEASCRPGQFGESCRYSCNCQECDQVTGACPGICFAGWVKGGQLCQKENIAYKKTATSTTNTGYTNWPVRNAVDGNNSINGESGTCFHGNNGRNEMTIDLGSSYKLYYIRVYIRSRYNRRIANSLIYLDGDRSRVCYTFPASVQDNPTDVVCDAVTRRLTIENPGTGIRDNTPLNICEVEIYKCSAGTYGENCTNFCHCGDCDIRTGVCTGNCFEGWKGDRCDTACDDTTYGINCVKGCHSRNCAPGSSSCDRFTGRCDKGCLPGWLGIDCTQQCDSSHYGQNCSKICAERNCYGTSDCNHVTGLCDSECKQGWMGIDCQQECDNSYGFNCNKTCGDRKCAGDMAPCDRFTGSCTPCLPGWQGVDCTEECDNLHYGSNCSRQCKSRHCTDIDSSCNRLSGRCDQGCLPGWRGDDCIQECDSPYYGTNCSRECKDRHCTKIDSSCNHVTGRCDQGCLPGWRGDDCIQACESTQYGQNCVRECGSRQCNGVDDCDSTSGQCLEGCRSGWIGIDCAEKLDEGGNVGIIAGVVVGCLAAIVVAIVVVVIIRKRRLQEGKSIKKPDAVDNVYANSAVMEEIRNKSPNLKDKPLVHQVVAEMRQGRSLDTEEDYDTDSVCTREGGKEEEEGAGKGEEGTMSYYNLNDVKRHTVIPVSQLEDKIDEIRKNTKLVEEEYMLLPDGFMHPYDESQRAENKSKNRYKGYYPYNYNRVVLRDVTDEIAGDYINASYVDGYQSEKKYIAAQGPYKDQLVIDFWRMLWQEGCKVVVMVTGLVETGRMKCQRYWPKNGSEAYGDVTVTKQSENVMADFTITTFTLQHKVEKKNRQVVHFHFTSWPDHGVPDTSALLSYMSKVRSSSGKQTHPIVVHCSAGIGRTGTYIAVEGLIQQAATEGVVDVVSFVTKMREQRKNMIQTKDQYHFIYRAVASAVLDGDTVLAAVDITKIDPRRVGETRMGNRTVQGHLETLKKEHKETNNTNTIQTVSSYRSRSGYLVMTSSPDKEELLEQIYNSGSRSLITWSGSDKNVILVDKTPVSTSRLTVTKGEPSELSDNIVLQKLEIKNHGESEGTVLYHYQLSGSVGELNVSALAESLLPWTDRPECRSSTIVSRSVSETRLLALLLNLISRLQDDGKMDIINDMRRLQSTFPVPRFTVADVRSCVKLAQQQLESLGVYANL